MKQLSRTLLTLLILASFGFMTSCDKNDDDPEPEPEGPSLSFIDEGPQWITGDAEVTEGDTVYVTWIARDGDNPLSQFRITGGPQGGTQFDTTLNEISTYEDTFQLSTSQTGEHTYTFEIVDSEGEEASKQITLTVNSNEPLNSYDQRLMGAQNNGNYGSFYSTSQDSVYFATNFNEANDIHIDFIYFYGSTNSATIAAPADPTMQDFSQTYGAASWDDRNETKFVEVTSASFSNFQTTADLEGYRTQLEGSSQTKANQLSTSSVYAFLTEGGKIGAFAVNNTDSQQGGYIDISVKVEP